MPPQAMPLTRILRYETHIVVVLCSPERMHSLTVQYALYYRYLQLILNIGNYQLFIGILQVLFCIISSVYVRNKRIRI